MLFTYKLENFQDSDLYQWRRHLVQGRGKGILEVEKGILLPERAYCRDQLLQETLPYVTSLYVFRLLSMKVTKIVVGRCFYRFQYEHTAATESGQGNGIELNAGSKIAKSQYIETQLPKALVYGREGKENELWYPGGVEKGCWIPCKVADLVLWLHRFTYRMGYFHLPEFYEWCGCPIYLTSSLQEHPGWDLPAVIE